jgi:hypothetical protein
MNEPFSISSSNTFAGTKNAISIKEFRRPKKVSLLLY